MSRQRPRRSRSLVDAMRGKFERHRRRNSCSNLVPADTVNVFCSDMLSNEFILRRLQSVAKDYKIVNIEIEDLIINGHRDTILPSVKKMILGGGRDWKSVCFVDSLAADQLQWWVQRRLEVMSDYNDALGNEQNKREMFTFQANIHCGQGTKLQSFLGLLRSIKQHNDIFYVDLAGALYGYGETSIVYAMSEAFANGELLETITVRIKSGWRDNPLWSNMLDACIQAALDLPHQQFAGNDYALVASASCSNLSGLKLVDFPGIPIMQQLAGNDTGILSTSCRNLFEPDVVDFRGTPLTTSDSTVDQNPEQTHPSMGFEATGIAIMSRQKSQNRTFGLPKRSRSASGVPRRSRSSVFPVDNRLREHLSCPDSRTDSCPVSRKGVNGTAQKMSEIPSYSWENRAIDSADKGSSAQPSYSWEDGTAITRTASSKSRVINPPSKRNLRRRHSAVGSAAVFSLAKSPEPPRCTRHVPKRSKSTDFEFVSCASQGRASRPYGSQRKSDGSDNRGMPTRHRYKRSKSMDFTHPTLSDQTSDASLRRRPRRSKSSISDSSFSLSVRSRSTKHTPRRSKSSDCNYLFQVSKVGTPPRKSKRGTQPESSSSQLQHSLRSGKSTVFHGEGIRRPIAVDMSQVKESSAAQIIRGPDFEWTSKSPRFIPAKSHAKPNTKKRVNRSKSAVSMTTTVLRSPDYSWDSLAHDPINGHGPIHDWSGQGLHTRSRSFREARRSGQQKKKPPIEMAVNGYPASAHPSSPRQNKTTVVLASKTNPVEREARSCSVNEPGAAFDWASSNAEGPALPTRSGSKKGHIKPQYGLQRNPSDGRRACPDFNWSSQSKLRQTSPAKAQALTDRIDDDKHPDEVRVFDWESFKPETENRVLGTVGVDDSGKNPDFGHGADFDWTSKRPCHLPAGKSGAGGVVGCESSGNVQPAGRHGTTSEDNAIYEDMLGAMPPRHVRRSMASDFSGFGI